MSATSMSVMSTDFYRSRSPQTTPISIFHLSCGCTIYFLQSSLRSSYAEQADHTSWKSLWVSHVVLQIKFVYVSIRTLYESDTDSMEKVATCIDVTVDAFAIFPLEGPPEYD
jgi:hypothetical protein